MNTITYRATDRRFALGIVAFPALVLVSACTVSGGGDGGGGGQGGRDAAGGAALSAEAERPPIRSRCAQGAINCTTCWPQFEPEMRLLLADGSQTVTGNAADGYVLQGSNGNGVEVLHLRGRESRPGNNSDTLLFSWSSGANDTDIETLEPGPEFSTDADPNVQVEAGFHYIRLTIRTDVVCDPSENEPFDPETMQGGAYDFVEFQVEVRD